MTISPARQLRQTIARFIVAKRFPLTTDPSKELGTSELFIARHVPGVGNVLVTADRRLLALATEQYPYSVALIIFPGFGTRIVQRDRPIKFYLPAVQGHRSNEIKLIGCDLNWRLSAHLAHRAETENYIECDDRECETILGALVRTAPSAFVP